MSIKFLAPSIGALLLVLGTHVFGADIAADVRGESNRDYDSDSFYFGYLELGVAAGYADPAQVNCCDEIESDSFFVGTVVGGEFNYKKFFFEAAPGTLDGITHGYNIAGNDRWKFDFLLSSGFGLIRDLNEDSNYDEMTEQEKNREIEERNTFFNGTGIRATAYFNDYIFQYRIVKDTHGGNGVISDLRMAHGWQYRNWVFHSLFNARYISAKANQYWNGVEEHQATAKYPVFLAEDGTAYTAEVGVTRPITQNWVFKGLVRYNFFDDDISNSPMVESDHESFYAVLVSYVF